jgi:hypothetical protein
LLNRTLTRIAHNPTPITNAISAFGRSKSHRL